MNGYTGFVQERPARKGERFHVWNTVVSKAPEDQGIQFVITRLLVGDIAELRLRDCGIGSMEGTITRPLALLRRVPAPNKNKPPIEGMPAERPRCAWCNAPLAAILNTEHTDGDHQKPVVRRVFVRWSAYEGLFHNTGCAIRFAGASYRGGYRRKR